MIYFIRHGQSEDNVAAIIAGQRRDCLLTKLGRQEAAKAALEAKKLKIDLIVSSPLKRALETARIIAKAIEYPEEKIIKEPDLMERDAGDLTGKPVGSLRRDVDLPNYEQDSEFYARAKRALKNLEKLKGDNVLVVSHNGFGRMLVVAAKNGQPDDFYDVPNLPNAHITKLQVRNVD